MNRARIVAALGAAWFAASASAQRGHDPFGWYGGDPDGGGGLSAEVNTMVSDSYVFDDFNHAGGRITGIHGKYYANFADLAGLEWEIRQGVKTGDGGTLVASGTATGSDVEWFIGWGGGFGFPGYVAEAHININLLPGTYHLAMSVVGHGSGRAFIATTSGANSVGSPIANDNSFFRSTHFGVDYGPARDQKGTQSIDFVYGIRVPSPGTLATMGVGMLGAWRRRR